MACSFLHCMNSIVLEGDLLSVRSSMLELRRNWQYSDTSNRIHILRFLHPYSQSILMYFYYKDVHILLIMEREVLKFQLIM